jgi:hypothetical protein
MCKGFIDQAYSDSDMHSSQALLVFCVLFSLASVRQCIEYPNEILAHHMEIIMGIVRPLVMGAR